MVNNLDLEFPLIRIFSKEYIKLEEDKKFLQEIVDSKASKKIVWSFIHYLEENALSIVDYADIIIKLCEKFLWMETEELRNQWGIEDEISKLIISLYDETANLQIVPSIGTIFHFSAAAGADFITGSHLILPAYKSYPGSAPVSILLLMANK